MAHESSGWGAIWRFEGGGGLAEYAEDMLCARLIRSISAGA
jgi:hypothetical protein